MKKNILTALFVLVVIGTLLTGCGSKSASCDSKNTDCNSKSTSIDKTASSEKSESAEKYCITYPYGATKTINVISCDIYTNYGNNSITYLLEDNTRIYVSAGTMIIDNDNKKECYSGNFSIQKIDK